MNVQVQFARSLYIFPAHSVHSHLLTRSHTHLAPSVSFKCCDLCGDLHAQIMFVLCFANQMIHNCLSLCTLACKSCGAQKEEHASQGWQFLKQRETGCVCGRAGQTIGLVSLSTCQTESPSAMMWSAWLYSVWSVVVPVGAIFIITIIHLCTSHLQVLLFQACIYCLRMLFIPGFSPCLGMFDSSTFRVRFY